MFKLKLVADTVLQDCKHSIWDYNINLQAEELRIKWICIITLLRAIGHVLQKVDSKHDVRLSKIIDKKFKEINLQKGKHQIYHEFIRGERNRFLKEYEHGILRILRPKPGKDKKGFSLSSDVSRNSGAVIVPNESDEIISYLASGPYKGMYEKNVAEEAYNWWVSIIDQIKEEYNNS